MPVSQGNGWAQLDFLGQSDHYRVLGWSVHPSTWLARDEQYVAFNNPSLAVGSGEQTAGIDLSQEKTLTGHMTEM